MSLFRFLLGGGLIFLGIGVFLSAYSVLSSLVEMAIQVWKRLFRSWARRRLHDLGIVRSAETSKPSGLNIRTLVWFLLVPLLALAVRDYLFSPLVMGFGALAIAWINFRTRQRALETVNEDAEIAALQVRSLLQVDHSLLNALKGIQLTDGQLKRALQQVISRLQMHQSPDQAVCALQGLSGMVTTRLSVLIANSARITDDIQYALLLTLEQEAHRQKLLRSRVRQTLALVRGTIRLLQGAAGAALIFVLLSPTWRSFFLQDMSHRTLLATLMACAVLASLYFEFEVYQLGSSEAFG